LHREVIGVTIIDSVIKDGVAPQSVKGYAINGNAVGGTADGGYIYRPINGSGGGGLGAPATAVSRMEDGVTGTDSEDIAGTAAADTTEIIGGTAGQELQLLSEYLRIIPETPTAKTLSEAVPQTE